MCNCGCAFSEQKSSVCLCDICGQDQDTHIENVASSLDSLWDEEFHAVAGLLAPDHRQHEMHRHTYTRSNCPVRGVFKINLLFIDKVRREGENNIKRADRLGAFERDRDKKRGRESNSACIPWEKDRPISPELTPLCCSYHHLAFGGLLWCLHGQTCQVCNTLAHQEIKLTDPCNGCENTHMHLLSKTISRQKRHDKSTTHPHTLAVNANVILNTPHWLQG